MIDVSDIDINKKNAALIRHTERYEIKEGELGDDVNITPNGIEMAIDFGKLLKSKSLIKIYTSPVKRCVHTAEKIIEGYGKKLEIIPSSMLGMPSAYIKNKKVAYENFNNYSFFEGYLKLIRGEKRLGFYSLEEGSEILYDFIKKTSTQLGLTLYISHDIVILYYIFYKTQKIYSEKNWLDFLDGIKLTFDD